MGHKSGKYFDGHGLEKPIERIGVLGNKGIADDDKKNQRYSEADKNVSKAGAIF